MRKVLAVPILLGVLIAAIPRADAGEAYTGHREGYQYQGDHYVKIVQAQTAFVPVLVPNGLLLNLAPSESPPPVTVSPEAFARYKAQMERQAGSGNADVIRELQALRKEVATLRSAKPERAVYEAGPRPIRRLLVEAPPAEEKNPPAGGSPRPGLAAYAGILKQHCAACHTGPKSRGKAQMFNAQGAYALKNVGEADIWRRVEDDSMPPESVPEKVPDSEKAVLKAAAGE